ncbi:hypothetical protein BHE90_009747 [Fusarium euwallaceae]|uniref:Uncharacterized protein n=2 Tax=Fusarium solani species complex TaxID=232080 RepID=A0A430LJA0_9HYPO|nr:hypothetical protein CEP51_007573 [Fusarium floridanum]RTE75808.1 hypothetical protein BHE90_009747 [Fusarium euwallaceae]
MASSASRRTFSLRSLTYAHRPILHYRAYEVASMMITARPTDKSLASRVPISPIPTIDNRRLDFRRCRKATSTTVAPLEAFTNTPKLDLATLLKQPKQCLASVP